MPKPERPSANQQRLDAFLCAVQARALRIAQIGTHSRDDALDVVQDAMLHLARAYAHRPEPEWPPLFYRILQNKVLDFQRRGIVRRRLFFQLPRASAEAELPSPEEQVPDPSVQAADVNLMQGEALVLLQTALTKLPQRQHQAFVLRIWEGLSTADTATAMNISEGSVKTHLSRALTSLRNGLGEAW